MHGSSPSETANSFLLLQQKRTSYRCALWGKERQNLHEKERKEGLLFFNLPEKKTHSMHVPAGINSSDRREKSLFLHD